MLSIAPRKRLGQFIFWEHIHNVLTKYDAVVRMSSTSEYNYTVVLDAKVNIPAIVHDLSEIGVVDVNESMGIVCVVGSNLINSSKVVDRIFEAIADIGISMISFGASKSNLSFVVNDEDVPEAVKQIHDEFFSDVETDEVFEVLEHLPNSSPR